MLLVKSNNGETYNKITINNTVYFWSWMGNVINLVLICTMQKVWQSKYMKGITSNITQHLISSLNFHIDCHWLICLCTRHPCQLIHIRKLILFLILVRCILIIENTKGQQEACLLTCGPAICLLGIWLSITQITFHILLLHFILLLKTFFIISRQ